MGDQHDGDADSSRAAALRAFPTALGWIDPNVTTAPRWDAARVGRLARSLGYVLVWPPVASVLPLVDQVRSADVDVVITPSSDHLDAITLHALMHVVDVETVCPRMSFARWAVASTGRPG
ncbi:hypothetical protein [Nocardia wallacei]|uniref:hypothetical protein n=1 Tax=Nocardia wallacei TaxID=480035 RepID=UPI002455EEE7|nr:hypothetical protein [Nocardia wallacei]